MTISDCADLVQRGDPDRFQAVISAPQWMRELLFPLYAFNLEVARAPWVSKEPMIAEMRLQWWRDVVEGAGVTPVRAHEVAQPFHDLIVASGLPKGVLDALIEARRRDISGSDPFASEEDLETYIEATGGGLMWLAARAIGAPEGAEVLARGVGFAQGLATYLVAVPELEARGRWPLPDGRPEAVAALAKRGLLRLDQAMAQRHLLPKNARGVLIAAFQARGLLTLAAKDPAAVAEGRLQLSEFQRRWQLLRLSFGAKL